MVGWGLFSIPSNAIRAQTDFNIVSLDGSVTVSYSVNRSGDNIKWVFQGDSQSNAVRSLVLEIWEIK